VLEYGEDYTDWEGYYSDEYYDDIDASKSKLEIQTSTTAVTSNEKPVAGVGLKRKSAGQRTPKKHKRRKLAPTQDIPELSLGESLDSDGELSEPCSPTPIVIWKTEETFTPLKWPVVGDREGKEVALLKDWRERFKIASKPDGDASDGTAEEQEDGMTSRSKGEAACPFRAPHTGKAGNGGKSLKGQASNKKEEGAQPRKRALPSRQATKPAARMASKLPTVSRKRKAEDDLPEPEEETDTASPEGATADSKTVRKAFAVVIPSSKSIPAIGQKKGVAPEPVPKKAKVVPTAAPTAEAGTGTRRSKRSKPG